MLNVAVTGLSPCTHLPKTKKPKIVRTLSVTEVLGLLNCRIELLPTMKWVNGVFHVTKLKKYFRAEIFNTNLSVVIDAEGSVEQEVKKILDKKLSRRKIYYLVQFKHDTKEDAIWMAKSELIKCKALICAYDESKKIFDSKQKVNLV